MTKLSSALLGAALIVGGCCPPKKADTTTTVVTPPTPDAGPTQEPPAPTPYEAAQAEVARLRAIADAHPLLAAWTGPYGGVPPWDKLDVTQLGSAYAAALPLLEAEAAVIAANPEAPTFANTFVPLEDAGRHLDRLDALFGVMTSNLSTPEVQAVDKEWSPKVAATYDRLTFNAALFQRIAAVYAARASLTPEQARLVTRRYQEAVRSGAQLGAADQATLGAINEQLAGKFAEFSARVLADEDTWIVLESQADLAGLSASQIAAYAAAAEERKLPGKWVVVNTRSSVDPFLAASARRDLRQRVWEAFKARGDHGDAHDTKALITDIVRLRAERAKLLGFATHAHWRMADTMAVDPAKANELMMRVWPAAVARVKEEVADMTAIARKEPGNRKFVLEPWDYLYYAEKVRAKKYALDQTQLTPYFELGHMIDASFYMAERLYGLHFTEITGTVPVFHPDVRVWKVEAADGRYVGLFYGDYFARAGKRSGAWATAYRRHETFTGTTLTPLASNNNNFVRGAAGAPVLISLDDAETLFHEFGHALHSLLSEVNYPGLGTTPRDFVEYPSQVHEQWVLSRPILDKFALHYQTGKPMPAALVAKIEKAATFNQGYGTVEYLTSAILDMRLHMLPDPSAVDPAAFERDTLAAIGAPREVAMRHRLPQFNHLFTSDAYSAGYYSYLWSEVMDADTRDAFREAGDVFDPTVAGKLRQHILAPGNTTDRAEAYRAFRGRDPDVGALLRKRGFPTK
ncbi:MAG: M3 family metallopeptidase [Myxococcales bacterium]|nr:M3 family metallopeptidase [Myxococcales bacterium]